MHKTWMYILGIFTTVLLASTCCMVPLIMVLLGISGTWLSSLHSLDVYKPYALSLCLLCIGVGFYDLYLKEKVCTTDSLGNKLPCANPSFIAVQKTVFWLSIICACFMLGAPLLLKIPVVASMLS